ncbi:WYL domain-containing protein [Paenibacillaceae bacterium]|nr:WYL domain-containing protein [Paenibacillaceae bacterium]
MAEGTVCGTEGQEPSETISKVSYGAASELTMNGAIMEKASSLERHVYHPLIRPLRRLIADRQGVDLAYHIRDGRARRCTLGFPYRLEFSMVKREWYLLWYNPRYKRMMSTKLRQIASVQTVPLTEEAAGQYAASMTALLEAHKEIVEIEVVRMYNRELSRILYAFSCFEKKVEYDAETSGYRIRLTVLSDEREYLLSKIRFLGMRVRVVSGIHLQQRMYETATNALARYGE